MEKNKKNQPTLSLREKIDIGMCCAHCSRELPHTNQDSVWLINGEGKKIRVCYDHIMNLTNRQESILPSVPKDIKRFDSREFLSNIRNYLENSQKKDPLINNFIMRSSINEFLKEL